MTPHLQTYHLLLPDLPSHASSRHLTPFSIPASTAFLAELIRAKAHHGKAHIVGLSLGAHIAVHLASNHSNLVLKVLVSGFEVFPLRSLLTPLIPYLLWFMTRLQSCVPRALIKYLMDGASIQRSDLDTVTLKLCREVVAPMFGGGKSWPTPWTADTLVVAAGKRGVLPTADHPGDARRLAEIGRTSGRAETMAVTHRAIRHPWNRQMPALFAECVRRWVEEGEVATGFERL